MNALEPDPYTLENLISWLDAKFRRHGELEDKYSAEMLRTLHAENEKLKQIIDANNLNQNIGQFVKAQEK